MPTRARVTTSQEQVAYVAPEESSPQLHLPVAWDPVKPIEAPKDMLRVGDFMVEQSATGLGDEDELRIGMSEVRERLNRI